MTFFPYTTVGESRRRHFRRPPLRSLYRGPEEFEQLMQLDVHLETHVLFSRAAAWMCRAGVEKQR
jgi:hypothetical protein